MLEDVLSVNHKSPIARLFITSMAAGLGARAIKQKEYGSYGQKIDQAPLYFYPDYLQIFRICERIPW
jgi:hypothetical protein